MSFVSHRVSWGVGQQVDGLVEYELGRDGAFSLEEGLEVDSCNVIQ